MKKPFLITIPHSGEQVPTETPWLKTLPETLLMFDVDRYVDQLYAPVIAALEIPSVKTDWHRYAIDLNRLPDDVDVDSVIGHKNAKGMFPRGLHWSITTLGEKLMPGPMPQETHNKLVELYFHPFHKAIRAKLEAFRIAGAVTTYHLDAHSMPSVGTAEHRDPGERRAEIVVSDCDGKSCTKAYRDLVVGAYEDAGFKVAVNWPYKGGRVTEVYGKPEIGQEAIQVEMSRVLYMNEQTKQLIPAFATEISQKVTRAIKTIYAAVPNLP